MTAFDDRKTAAEAKFSMIAEAKFTHDQEFQFKGIATDENKVRHEMTRLLEEAKMQVSTE